MRPIEIIDAPSVLGLFPHGVERLADVLHEHGLAELLGARSCCRIDPPPYQPGVDPATGINNSDGIITYAAKLADTVTATMDSEAFALVLGGDCSIIFGPLLALRRRGNFGLLFLDGHADFAHPSSEPSGEAASMDLALATGRGPAAFVHADGRRRLVDDEHVAVLGYRAHDDGTDTCAGVHIDDTPITAIDLDEFRRRGRIRAIADALAVVNQPHLDGFWVHLDIDVLDDNVMPAVDYRNPGGLSFDELTTILRAAIETGRACGLDVTIFNPDLDPGGHLARRIVEMLTDCLE